MKQDQYELKSKQIFSRLPAQDPSPYFAARVAARATAKGSKEILIWRWVTAFSIAAVIALTSYIQFQPKSDLLYTYEPYVIQVDFTEKELKLARSAEIELPDGISFVSKNEVVKSLRSLRLPVNTDKGRLPFVVVSELTGEVPLQIRMYNANDELIETRTLTLNFGKKG